MDGQWPPGTSAVGLGGSMLMSGVQPCASCMVSPTCGMAVPWQAQPLKEVSGALCGTPPVQPKPESISQIFRLASAQKTESAREHLLNSAMLYKMEQHACANGKSASRA